MTKILIDKGELINSLREKHKYLYQLDLRSLRVLNIAPDYAVIRPMTRREFNLISLDPERSTQAILSKCLLYPNLDEYSEAYLAGIDSVIAATVNNISGFLTETTLLQGVLTYREYAKSLEATILMFICKAFPSYKAEDIDNMCFEDQMRLAALAEQIVGQPIPYDEFLNPKKEKKEKKPKDSLTKKQERLEEFREKRLAEARSIHKESFVNERLIKKEDFRKEMDNLQEFLKQEDE